MGDFEPKKLALLRIQQILEKYSDYDHPLTQEDIAGHLVRDYGIEIERKAISRNLSLLREAGFEIVSRRDGSYLHSRRFEDSELRMLIDGILSSKYITARHSADLIDRLCGLSNTYFRSHVQNIYSVNDWSKTDNQALFLNIEQIDEAIDRQRQITFDYNKYGMDKKLHKTTSHTVSPYQLLLHNQRYYLMSLHERFKNITYFRLDHITNMRLCEDAPITDIRTVEGYENGIDYREFTASRPYMFSDKAELVEFAADAWMIDQIVDWFGYDIKVREAENGKILVSLKVSPSAMEYWALQFLNYVEVLKPQQLREKLREDIKKATEKYDI